MYNIYINGPNVELVVNNYKYERNDIMDFISNVIDNAIIKNMVTDKDFFEFCRCLNDIEMLTLTPDYFSEEVSRATPSETNAVAKTIRNTAKTTKDVSHVMGITTDAGAMGIKSAWDLIMKLAGIAAKTSLFIMKNLVLLPKAIIKTIDTVGNIPKDVKRRIRGDITLYITIDSVQVMMDRYILQHMMNLVAIATKLSKGEMWTTLTRKEHHREQSTYNNPGVDKSSDMQLIKKMKQEYSYFSQVRFDKTTINMSDPDVVESYFGTGKLMYKDIHGVQHEDTYYNLLKELVQMISARKAELDGLYTDIGEKIKLTQTNSNFASMNSLQRKAIMDSMTMMTKTIGILGNVIKYMMMDINTIQKATSQILSRQDAISSGSGKKKIGRSDDAIKDLEVGKDQQSDAADKKSMESAGYVLIGKYIKDKTGKVIKKVEGEPDTNNKDAVWVKKNNIPKSAIRL